MNNTAKQQEALERYHHLESNCADSIQKCALSNPQGIAIIEHDTNANISWAEFDFHVNATAATLIEMGLKKGEILATSLSLTKEHIFLIYACYRIGIIIAPLDLRLKCKDLVLSFGKMQPSAYFFTGRMASEEFRETMHELQTKFSSVKHWVQYQADASRLLPKATHANAFYEQVGSKSQSFDAVSNARSLVGKRDPALIIFTTGSTGSPKPAQLCHENILVQTLGLCTAFDFVSSDRFLVNLPASHVGCTTEQLGSIVFAGGTAVILAQFDAAKSLEAVMRHKVTIFAEIPAMFVSQWRLSNFREFDLSSVRVVMYGGQAVSLDFLHKLSATICPKIITGLGLTEVAGFCTYTNPNASPEEISESLGFDSPLCKISIREPITPNGSAGKEKQPGEIGEVCFSGPQVFLGYLGDENSTRATISTDGVCYTGDLGSYDAKGLHFSGRAKHVIKPKGFQVFPGDIENHVQESLAGKVGMVGCVGAPHELYTEGIMLFVERSNNADLTTNIISQVCKELPSYSRPSHIEIINPGELPLNRVGKTDYVALRAMATTLIPTLRTLGKWDCRG